MDARPALIALALAGAACGPAAQGARAGRPGDDGRAGPRRAPWDPRRPAGLHWDAAAGALTCGPTATRVRVAPGAAAVMREGADSVQFVAPGQALLVRVRAGRASPSGVFDDWAAVFALLGAPSEHVEARALTGEGGFGVRFELRAWDANRAGYYRLESRVIERNGAVLSVTLLSGGDAPPGPSRPLVDAVEDSPGFDLSRAPSPARPAAPAAHPVWPAMREPRAIDAFAGPPRAPSPDAGPPPGDAAPCPPGAPWGQASSAPGCVAR